MKEVTYEQWQKNPTPREMWVWDNSFDVKKKAKVICVAKDDFHLPVMTVTKDYAGYCSYRHCAEIEEPKYRRYTNQELAWWLLDGIKEGKHREWSYNFFNDLIVHSYFDYTESIRDKPVDDDIQIREDGGEWREPLVEVEE